MRYYDLGRDGFAVSSSRWPHEDWQRLPDQPSEFHFWDGSQWVEDPKARSEARKEHLRTIALDQARQRVESHIASSVLADIESGAISSEEDVRRSNKYKAMRST